MDKNTPIASVTTAAIPNHGKTAGKIWSWIGIEETSVSVSTFEQAIKSCRDFIASNEITPDVWAGGEVFDSAGNNIAHIDFYGSVYERTGKYTVSKNPINI